MREGIFKEMGMSILELDRFCRDNNYSIVVGQDNYIINGKRRRLGSFRGLRKGDYFYKLVYFDIENKAIIEIG